MAKEREDKVKALRLLKLEHLIKTLSYPNATDLRKKLEVSLRTIMRDLEFLRDQYNAPIEYDSFHKGYYFTDKTFFVKRGMLSEAELLTVSTMLPLMDQYKNTPLENAFKSVFEKLYDMLPTEIKVDSSFINDVQFISDPLPKIDVEIFNGIFTSICNKKTVQFGYRSIENTEWVPREFDPYKVICQKGNWYVFGFCHKHQKFMVYSLSRMKDLIILDEFNFIEDFEKHIHIDPNIGIWNNDVEPIKIELLFSKEINTYILERTWHKDQDCKQNDDGSVYLSFTSNQTQELKYWIMSFGSAVKVLSPETLREDIKRELLKSIESF